MKGELEHQLEHSAFDDQPFTDRLLMLVNAQIERRRDNKIKSLTNRAKFEYLAAPQDIKFMSGRNLAKSEVLELLKCDWIDRGQHVLLTGSSGTGKPGFPVRLGWRLFKRKKQSGTYEFFNLSKRFSMPSLMVHFELIRKA